MKKEMCRLYNITNAAKLLGVSRLALYDWEKKGIIKFIKVGNFNKVSENEIRRLRGGE